MLGLLFVQGFVFTANLNIKKWHVCVNWKNNRSFLLNCITIWFIVEYQLNSFQGIDPFKCISVPVPTEGLTRRSINITDSE